MPELPDVQEVIRRIKKKIINKKIGKIVVLSRKIIVTPAINRFREALVGKKIKAISRRGKFILITLSSTDTLVVHLRMTGDLKIVSSKNKIHKHTRVIFSLSSGIDLRYIDPRKLGKMYLVPDSNFKKIKLLLEMGPEPLSDEFTEEEFRRILGKHRGSIKALLLNQRFIAGIGNVYGDEILFHAGIHPLKSPDDFSENEIRTLYSKIKSVLATAVKMRAAPWIHPRWLMGERGEGGSCPKCSRVLDRVHIQGRYSYFCPKCQKR